MVTTVVVVMVAVMIVIVVVVTGCGDDYDARSVSPSRWTRELFPGSGISNDERW